MTFPNILPTISFIKQIKIEATMLVFTSIIGISFIDLMVFTHISSSASFNNQLIENFPQKFRNAIATKNQSQKHVCFRTVFKIANQKKIYRNTLCLYR